MRCLDSPPKYFAEVIGMAFRDDTDKNAKAGLTRVVVSRADEDMEEIKDAYAKQHTPSSTGPSSPTRWPGTPTATTRTRCSP